MQRPRAFSIATGTVAGFITLTVAVLPAVPFAYRNLGLHAALETAEGCIGLLVAYLVFGRFRQRGFLNDLGLV